MKVAFAPNGHIEATVILCDDGPVVSIQSETANPPDGYANFADELDALARMAALPLPRT